VLTRTLFASMWKQFLEGTVALHSITELSMLVRASGGEQTQELVPVIVLMLKRALGLDIGLALTLDLRQAVGQDLGHTLG
jgi:hypothetical protein